MTREYSVANVFTFQFIKLPLAIVLVLSVVWFLLGTFQWPLAGDATLIHYVVFLAHHGFVPYKDIGDINLPGCYFPDFFITKLFGSSSLAWRLYDFALLGVIVSAFRSITKSLGWFPALWAGCLFAVIHGRDGIDQAGQRDLAAAALLVVGILCLLWSRRIGRPWIAAFWGMSAGAAAMIKPTLAPFILISLVDISSEQVDADARRRSLAALSSWFVAPAICFLWLLREGALSGFWYSVRVLAPYHAGLGHVSWNVLLHNASSPVTLVLFPWGLALAHEYFLRREKLPFADSSNVERRILLAATFLGLLSYLLQRKGFPYHRYPFLIFLLLVVGMDLTVMLRRKRVTASLCACALVWSSVIVAPSSALKADRYDWQHHEFQSMLEEDLNQIAHDRNIATLAFEVECLDTTSGCVSTLQFMQIPETFGMIYDEFLFHPSGSSAIDDTRARFLGSVKAHPPIVLIVTEPLFPSGPDHYEKLAQWPAFQSWLNENYSLYAERHPTMPIRTMGRSIVPSGYRLYVSRNK